MPAAMCFPQVQAMSPCVWSKAAVIAYDPHLPLFVMHLPKTAGMSVREVFADWFRDGLLLHYFEEGTGRMPVKYDLAALHSNERPVAVYGHFNKTRGFGIPHYYPDARQFITILRDPFERTVSSYFFLRKHGPGWKDQARIPKDDLRTHLLNSPGRMVNHFPCDITLDNYRDVIESMFIEVGIIERLDDSMARIASRLGKTYRPESMRRLNTTDRDQRLVTEDMRQEFVENNPLEYAIYNYVRAKYG